MGHLSTGILKIITLIIKIKKLITRNPLKLKPLSITTLLLISIDFQVITRTAPTIPIQTLNTKNKINSVDFNLTKTPKVIPLKSVFLLLTFKLQLMLKPIEHLIVILRVLFPLIEQIINNIKDKLFMSVQGLL